MKKELHLILYLILLSSLFETALSQPVTNKNFSFGSYGRVGAGVAVGNTGNIGRSLNLNGMGSIGGRMEEADYVELAAALHFKTEIPNDTTHINVQARLALYSGKGQLIGNVNSSSQYGGITLALPELYAEALTSAAQNGVCGLVQNIFAGMMYISPTIIISMITVPRELALLITKQRFLFYFLVPLTRQALFHRISI